MKSSSSSPAPGKHHPCPRCDSTNTKFCYYNNYNLSQPRHFCKACRRYWTLGGTLRNIPVGGGTRKSTSSSKRRRVGEDDVAVNMMVMGGGRNGRGGVPDSSAAVINNKAAAAAAAAVASEPSDSGLKSQDAVGLSPFNGGFDQGFFSWPNIEELTAGAGGDYGEYFSWPELATETHL
ncbi:hypothetical protein M569_06985 [Genlisea aurea]|uniref:Dof zinc finger protein n=1 Tax=Genlisea aurea TaxID=192259 RepID=S8CKR5_9LAMI|nr:hypothetical protein M569_06985 [Genlisea aurea]